MVLGRDTAQNADWEVIIVKFGTRECLKSEVYLNFPYYHRPDGPIGMDYYFWVIRSQDSVTVVDTGFSSEAGAKRGRTTLVEPAQALSHLGINPTEVDRVVITHAHYDHAGNLKDFPNAEIVMAQAEYDFVTSDMITRPQFRFSTDTENITELREAAEHNRVRFFSDTLKLAPGLTLHQVGGHTPGQTVVTVRTSEGQVTLASDAVHYYEELEADMPFTLVADVPGTYRAFDRVMELAAGHPSLIVAGHDPQVQHRFPPDTEGPLAGLASRIGRINTERD